MTRSEWFDHTPEEIEEMLEIWNQIQKMEDIRTAKLQATIITPHVKRGVRVTARDFLPREKQTTEQQIAILQTWARSENN